MLCFASCHFPHPLSVFIRAPPLFRVNTDDGRYVAVEMFGSNYLLASEVQG